VVRPAVCMKGCAAPAVPTIAASPAMAANSNDVPVVLVIVVCPRLRRHCHRWVYFTQKDEVHVE
jgi:hypothetical protein